jgi:hypothetical protein
MSEWWSYGLSDFLMFSPQAYWRLVERYNAAWWPAQLAGLVAAGALLALPRHEAGWSQRTVLLLLALAWGWTGWAFHTRTYAEIFLAAPWLAAASGAQAILLTIAAVGGLRPAEPASRMATLAGCALSLVALFFPLASPLQGYGWTRAEVFGFMPDPTALATVGALMVLRRPHYAWRALLGVIPVLALLLGAATRWLLA